MSRIFDVVQSLSGQKNVVIIPRPYLRFFKGEQQCHALAAVLNQLVFWSGCSTLENGWFYKSHKELAEEIGDLSEDQTARLVDKVIKKHLSDVIETTLRKVNGTPQKHYRICEELLIKRIFPEVSDSAKSRNGNREVTESIPQNRDIHSAVVKIGNREVAESFLYTDHNKQISKPTCQPATQSDDSSDENFLALHPEAVVFNAKKRKWGGADDLTAAEWMWGKILRMYEQAAECDGEIARPKEPDMTLWANEIRLMCTADGRTHKQICELFGRANRDPFWCKNILSPSKLREKWDDLTIKLSANVVADTSAGGHWNSAEAWENTL